MNQTIETSTNVRPEVASDTAARLLRLNHEILSDWANWHDRGLTPPPREPNLIVTFVEVQSRVGMWSARTRTAHYIAETIHAIQDRLTDRGHHCGPYKAVVTEFRLAISHRDGSTGRLLRVPTDCQDGEALAEIVELHVEGRAEGDWLHIASGFALAPRWDFSPYRVNRPPFLGGLGALVNE